MQPLATIIVVTYYVIIRPHLKHRMNVVCCYTRRTFRGQYVCLSGRPVFPAKTAEPIKMPFAGLLVWPYKPCIRWNMHIGATWRIRLNNPCVRRCGFVSNFFNHLLLKCVDQRGVLSRIHCGDTSTGIQSPPTLQEMLQCAALLAEVSEFHIPV